MLQWRSVLERAILAALPRCRRSTTRLPAWTQDGACGQQTSWEPQHQNSWEPQHPRLYSQNLRTGTYFSWFCCSRTTRVSNRRSSSARPGTFRPRRPVQSTSLGTRVGARLPGPLRRGTFQAWAWAWTGLNLSRRPRSNGKVCPHEQRHVILVQELVRTQRVLDPRSGDGTARCTHLAIESTLECLHDLPRCLQRGIPTATDDPGDGGVLHARPLGKLALRHVSCLELAPQPLTVCRADETGDFLDRRHPSGGTARRAVSHVRGRAENSSTSRPCHTRRIRAAWASISRACGGGTLGARSAPPPALRPGRGSAARPSPAGLPRRRAWSRPLPARLR